MSITSRARFHDGSALCECSHDTERLVGYVPVERLVTYRQTLRRNQPFGYGKRRHRFARFPQYILASLCNFAGREVPRAAVGAPGRYGVRIGLRREQPYGRVNVRQTRAQVPNLLFQIVNVSADFRPLLAERGDNVCVAHTRAVSARGVKFQ
jgi:hypothetical protein